MNEPDFPSGLPLVLDPEVRVYDSGRVLLGGDPGRLLRFRPGRSRVPDVLSAGVTDARTRSLARLLVDGGLAHPRPAPAAIGGVAVVVPVRDRVAALGRCLEALDGGQQIVVVDDGSVDPGAVADVCERHGARVVHQRVNTGPAGARNAGIAATDAPLIAFVDSDCIVPAGWLTELLGHFDDPAVGAVAPRIQALDRSRSLLSRYASARGALDLGPAEARVRPGGRVSYVPTAALVVRRAALQDSGPFDPALRFGEDVDLVWRLHDAGWTVRYDPRTTVAHSEPATWTGWLVRRHSYGTSAGPLGVRHGNRLAPLVLSGWMTVPLALLAVRRPVPALTVAAVSAGRLYRRLRGAGLPAGPCVTAAVHLTAKGLLATARSLGGSGTAVTTPLFGIALVPRQSRTVAAIALLGPPLLDHLARRPDIDPLRWTVLRLLDDLAYATGVWRGCAIARTSAPLRPRRSATP